MTIENKTDGTYTMLVVSDSGKHFEFEIHIQNNDGGNVTIDYYNSERECYNLLTVTETGAISNEVPKIE